MSATCWLPDDDLEGDLLEACARARAFAADKLAPFAREIDEQVRFRRETVHGLGAAGYLAGPIATELGGGGWNARTLAVVHEEIGAVCGNARGFLAVQTGLVGHCLSHASESQRERWLPSLMSGAAIGCFGLTEPEAGSDVGSMQSHAEPDGDGYRLRGEKIWITNGGVADVCVVFANTTPGNKKGITGFVIPTDREGLRREPMPGVDLGHRGSDHARLIFEGVHATADDVLGGADQVGTGLRRALAALGAGRLSVAAGAVGIHRAALAASLEFCTHRRQFGHALSSMQMVQERLADMTVELLAARGLVHQCARRRDAGRERNVDLAAAKLYATEAASRACDQAVLLHGGRGYSSAYPVERLLRDAMALRIYEGTSMIQKTIIARELTGR